MGYFTSSGLRHQIEGTSQLLDISSERQANGVNEIVKIDLLVIVYLVINKISFMLVQTIS